MFAQKKRYSPKKVKSRHFLTNISYNRLKRSDFDNMSFIIDCFTYILFNLMMMILGDQGMVGYGLGFICISFVFLFTATSHSFVLYVNLLWPPASGVKIYGFPWRLLLFFCLHMANLSCHLFTHRCTLSWYFNDVKSIVLSFRPYPAIPLSLNIIIRKLKFGIWQRSGA